MIETVRERKERSGRPGRQDRSVRYFIMSAEITPERLLKPARSHWKIENSLHWALDVVMNEDQLRNRTLNGPECLAAIRRIALNIVRLMDDKKHAQGTDADRRDERRISARTTGERHRKILKAKALHPPGILDWFQL